MNQQHITGLTTYELLCCAQHKRSKATEPVLTNKPSAKVGVNTEKKFYGLDVSAGVKIIFGVKVQFKIGFQQK